MSWHCSLALVEELSALNCLDGEQCAELKSNRTAERSYFDGKKKGSSNRFPSGTTSEHSTGNLGVGKWILSLPDSHASPSLSPESKQENLTNGTCGLKQYESFAKYDPDTASWRTSQISLFTNTTERYSKTWPKAGMVFRGVAYLQPSAERRIREPGSGFWRTPHASDGEGGIMTMHKDKAGHYKLRDHVQEINWKMWPTPRAGNPGSRPNKKGGKILAEEVKKWPTPAVRDHKGSNSEKHCKVTGKGRKHMDQLPNAVAHGGTSTPQTYPTPTSQDNQRCPSMMSRGRACRDFRAQEPTGQLNPDWVEWLMGWPIGWTDLKPLGMDKFRKWLELHGNC